MTGDHHGRNARRATLLVRAVDALLGTHNCHVAFVLRSVPWPQAVCSDRRGRHGGGRAARRAAQVEAVLGRAPAPAALDLLELAEFAWHDCYGEITPPDDVVDDVLICSRGDLAQMVRVTRLVAEDSRDLRIAADALRAEDR
jgi:hypothetical protein